MNRLLNAPKACGTFAVVIGLAVITGWYAHWTTIIQIGPGLPPMKYNTALAFILSGVGLLLLPTKRARLASWFGAIVALIGFLTLVEYLAGENFGIDQIFFKSYIDTATQFPGRMSPLAASCFAFLGVGISLAGIPFPNKGRLTAIGMLSCIVSMVACVAIFGYAFGIEAAYGWGAYTRMAIHTAVTFFLLGAGLVTWAWTSAERLRINLLRWLPLTCSMTLMVMIAFISFVSFDQLEKSTAKRKHTYAVLGVANDFLADIFNTQRGMRNYVLTGRTEAVQVFEDGQRGAEANLASLESLTSDNPGQQQRAKVLTTDFADLIHYARRLIDLRQQQGMSPAVAIESGGQGFAIINQTLADLKAFTAEEHRLLDLRDGAAESDFRNTQRLLIAGSMLAALLLLAANLLTSRELKLRFQAEALLRQSSGLQKAILNSANYAIISTDPEGTVTTFNSTAERWLGLSAKETIGKLTPAAWHDREQIAARMRAAEQTLGRRLTTPFEAFTYRASRGQVDEGEWTFVRKDQSRFPVWLSVTALTDPKGDITGYLGVISDIADRKKAAEELAANEALLRQFITHTPAAIAMLDTEMRYLQTSQRWLTDYHLTGTEVIGRTHYEVFPDVPERWRQIHKRVLQGAVERCEEDEFPRADGRIEWLQWEARPWYKSEGKIGGVIFFTQVITARKEAEVALREKEEALRLSEERFSNAFEHAPIGMALVSLEGKWLKVNQALSQFIGYTQDELLFKTFQDITHPDDLSSDLDKLHLLVDDKIPSYHMEKRYFHKDGHIVWALLGVSLIRNKQNKPLYFISQIQDITAIKAAMEQQAELTRKAQTAEKAKSEFLAIMSHEIRTPMNGVIGMTSILSDTELTEMQRDCVNTIHTSGESLLSVINDILDFSKIESGKMTLESRPFNLQQCVEDSLDLFSIQIRTKGLEGVYFVSPTIPPYLLGDALRLRQILVNLVGNAIKFTKKGDIVIKVESQSQDESGCHLLFSVTDTGIGIPPEGLDKLFHAFQQVDTSTTRRYGGTGLGLAISKRLTEFMGGKMWAESKVGTGSTFFFTTHMEVAPVSSIPDHAIEPAMPQAITALIVDDNDTNRQILDLQLKNWGITPVTASSGPEAMELIKRQKFDVALLDYQMPEVDGVTLAREIRRHGPTPMILLSSSGEIIVGNDALLFQFQISKPIKHSLLFSALLRTTGLERMEPSKTTTKRFDSGLAIRYPLRILLAEDNAVNQKVGLKMLSQLGYTADLAGNGKIATEAALKTTYDLILMDIQMPEMDGVTATGQIREKLKSRTPYVVALTAEALEGDRDRFINLGFDNYLSKPLQAAPLQEMLKKVKPQA